MYLCSQWITMQTYFLTLTKILASLLRIWSFLGPMFGGHASGVNLKTWEPARDKDARCLAYHHLRQG